MFEVKVMRPTDVKSSSSFKTQDCPPECSCVHIKFKTKKSLEKSTWKDLRREIMKHFNGLGNESQTKENFIHTLKDHYFLKHGHNVDDF